MKQRLLSAATKPEATWTQIEKPPRGSAEVFLMGYGLERAKHLIHLSELLGNLLIGRGDQLKGKPMTAYSHYFDLSFCFCKVYLQIYIICV